MTTRQGPARAISYAEILEAARVLGVLSGSAHAAPRILATLCQPEVSPREVGLVIGQEPGLTARVLRVANSAFYGVSRAIATIDRAVVVLGLDAVRGIAAAACLDRNLLRVAESSPLDVADLLRHSVAAAAAAEALARLGPRRLAPEAFIAGLLHDLGTILQLRLDPEGLSALVAAALAAPGTPVRQLEERHARVGHEPCAAVLFEAWQLPDSLVAAVRHHHDPAGAPDADRPLAALVHLGEHLAVACGMGFGPESGAAEPDPAALRAAGLSATQLALVADALPQLVGHLQGALAD